MTMCDESLVTFTSPATTTGIVPISTVLSPAFSRVSLYKQFVRVHTLIDWCSDSVPARLQGMRKVWVATSGSAWRAA